MAISLNTLEEHHNELLKSLPFASVGLSQRQLIDKEKNKELAKIKYDEEATKISLLSAKLNNLYDERKKKMDELKELSKDIPQPDDSMKDDEDGESDRLKFYSSLTTKAPLDDMVKAKKRIKLQAGIKLIQTQISKQKDKIRKENNKLLTAKATLQRTLSTEYDGFIDDTLNDMKLYE